MKKFGERIREARKAHQLTLEALARMSGTHKGYLSSMESVGVRPPSPKITAILAKKLELPVDEMLTLAYWEKRPKGVTEGTMSLLLRASIESDQAPAKEAV